MAQISSQMISKKCSHYEERDLQLPIFKNASKVRAKVLFLLPKTDGL